MKRILVLIAAVLAVAIYAAPDAWAHGGNFRGPGGSVPPGLREPSDPTPPPPPPPTGPPTTPSPVTPSPKGPAPVTPGTTPTNTPPPVTGPDVGGGNRQPKTQPTSFEDWTFWYHNNKDDIENLKAMLYALRGSDNPLFQPGRADEGSRTSATRLTAQAVEAKIIPALLWAMDPKNAGGQDTESASYLALAKMAKDPEQIRLIQKGLDKQLNRDQIVQESAALALGLLRRARPADQFSARELDKVREFLFGIFQDGDYQARVRGFAALAVGLLGDQPTGSGEYANDVAAAQRATTVKLFELLQQSYADNDLYVAILMAIGLQNPDSVTVEDRGVLADCALKGRLYREDANNLTRAYAALALGRIGTKDDIGTMENILQARRGVDDNVRRSAAIGLGLLGKHVDGEDRVKVASVLLRNIDRLKDNSTINFAIVSLAYLLIDDIQAGATDVITGAKVTDFLLETATKGKYLHRPFAALALGLIVREIPNELEIDAYQEFKEAALGVLREGLTSSKLSKLELGAFCTAVGIARDLRSREPLIALVADDKEDKELRGYAALGLGLIGDASAPVTKAIAQAMQERSSAELRRQTATALGLLGNPTIAGTGKDAVQLLIEELKEAKSQNHKGQVVLALARVGDHRVVDELVALLMDTKEQELTRALACAGLGLIGDLEFIPSLARLSKNVNYRASTNLVDEVLSIL